jgi:tetratricopeptide (TPR) repeat protein
VELAKVLRAQGNMGEALDLLLKAAVLDPSDAEPLFLAGNIYLDIKKPDEAKLQFQRVLTINKNFPLVYYHLGRAALLQNDPREALAQAELEKRAMPNVADAYLLAADAHAQMQQFSNCATEYQKAIKLRPQNAATYVKNAQCYRKAGNLDAATAMLNVAATKESGLADIYKEQGAIYELKGDVAHAIEAYNQYFVLDPDAPDRTQIEDRVSALQRGQTP